MWKLKYRSRIRIYGVLDILDGVSSIPPDGKSSYNDDDLLLRSKNEELYADLILNIQDEASFGCVSRARTKDFKEGLASLAWKNLVEKYEGLEKSNKMYLKRELLSSHLNKNDDPDGWITKLEKIKWELENNHNEFMSEEDFVSQIIILIPQEYDLLYNSLQLQINNGSYKLTTEN